MRKVVLLLAASAGLAVAGHALAQQPAGNSAAPAKGQTAPRPWVAPGTPGSPIDGTIFHAQVLLDAAGFPSGVIDGKKGMVFAQAVKGFQQSRNLPVTGELDGATRVHALPDAEIVAEVRAAGGVQAPGGRLLHHRGSGREDGWTPAFQPGRRVRGASRMEAVRS